MSAESTLVFWGIRYEVPHNEIALLDQNTHPLIKQARQNRLDFFGGNFAEPDERYFLFIGKKLGMVGGEYSAEILMREEELKELVAQAGKRLHAGAFQGQPQLFVQWMPDA